MVTQGKTARFLLLILVLAGMAAGAVPGSAATRDVSVGLYLVNPGTECLNAPKFGCEGSPQLKGSLNTPYYVYLAVFNGDPEVGIGGLSCGIDYSGGTTVVNGWQLCSGGLEFPSDNWPSPGGGNKMTFETTSNCQTEEPDGDGVTAVFGYFYVTAYGDDRMAVVPNRAYQSGGPRLVVAECDPPAETQLDPETRAGWVGFGSEDGDLPCVEKTDTTWGHIKSNTDWQNR
jgi:hypothetical protein